MANETNKDMKLPSLDDLFTTQEERDDAKLKRIHEIPIREIDSFPDHPFFSAAGYAFCPGGICLFGDAIITDSI